MSRPRKHNPNIPKHIDQTKIPRGLYWSNIGKGRWFVVVPDPNGGRPSTKVIAGPTAQLSDLRAIMDRLSGNDAKGTIGGVGKLYAQSMEFAEKSRKTQKDYNYCLDIARKYKTDQARGPTLDTLFVDRLTLPAIQKVIETIARGRAESRPGAGDGMTGFPSKANHLLRYLRMMFAWGMRHGHCKTNPAMGTRQARERRRHGMPTTDAYNRVLEFVRERGLRTPHSLGSSPPYLWPLLEIKYLCRMGSVEVLAMTEAHESERGLYISRTKGSNDNIVKWTPRLRAAWERAKQVRAETLARRSNKGRPVPIRPDQRFIFLGQDGSVLSSAGLDNAWQDLIHAAMDAGVIAVEERFTLHGLKHRGVTDTEGSRQGKQLASGHKSESMVALYDHEVPIVDPASPRSLPTK